MDDLAKTDLKKRELAVQEAVGIEQMAVSVYRKQRRLG